MVNNAVFMESMATRINSDHSMSWRHDSQQMIRKYLFRRPSSLTHDSTQSCDIITIKGEPLQDKGILRKLRRRLTSKEKNIITARAVDTREPTTNNAASAGSDWKPVVELATVVKQEVPVTVHEPTKACCDGSIHLIQPIATGKNDLTSSTPDKEIQRQHTCSRNEATDVLITVTNSHQKTAKDSLCCSRQDTTCTEQFAAINGSEPEPSISTTSTPRPKSATAPSPLSRKVVPKQSEDIPVTETAPPSLATVTPQSTATTPNLPLVLHTEASGAIIIPYIADRVYNLMRNLYIAYPNQYPVPSETRSQWTWMRTAFEIDLLGAFSSSKLCNEDTLCAMELCMIGCPDNDLVTGVPLRLEPTILIRCKTRKCKKLVTKTVQNLTYLTELNATIMVVRCGPDFAGSSSYVANASDSQRLTVMADEAPSEAFRLQVHRTSANASACGMEVTASLRGPLAQSVRSFTLGGIIIVNSEVFGLATAAHALFPNLKHYDKARLLDAENELAPDLPSTDYCYDEDEDDNDITIIQSFGFPPKPHSNESISLSPDHRNLRLLQSNFMPRVHDQPSEAHLQIAAIDRGPGSILKSMDKHTREEGEMRSVSQVQRMPSKNDPTTISGVVTAAKRPQYRKPESGSEHSHGEWVYDVDLVAACCAGHGIIAPQNKPWARRGVEGVDIVLIGGSIIRLLTNDYLSPKAQTKVSVDGYLDDSMLTAGPVHIICRDMVREGVLLEDPSLFFAHGSVFRTRRVLVTDRLTLPTGISGSWVVRDNMLCGSVIARYPQDQHIHILTASKIMSGVRQITGQDIVRIANAEDLGKLRLGALAGGSRSERGESTPRRKDTASISESLGTSLHSVPSYSSIPIHGERVSVSKVSPDHTADIDVISLLLRPHTTPIAELQDPSGRTCNNDKNKATTALLPHEPVLGFQDQMFVESVRPLPPLSVHDTAPKESSKQKSDIVEIGEPHSAPFRESNHIKDPVDPSRKSRRSLVPGVKKGFKTLYHHIFLKKRSRYTPTTAITSSHLDIANIPPGPTSLVNDENAEDQVQVLGAPKIRDAAYSHATVSTVRACRCSGECKCPSYRTIDPVLKSSRHKAPSDTMFGAGGHLHNQVPSKHSMRSSHLWPRSEKESNSTDFRPSPSGEASRSAIIDPQMNTKEEHVPIIRQNLTGQGLNAVTSHPPSPEREMNGDLPEHEPINKEHVEVVPELLSSPLLPVPARSPRDDKRKSLFRAFEKKISLAKKRSPGKWHRPRRRSINKMEFEFDAFPSLGVPSRMTID